MKHIAIIGLGVIGGSFAKAIREHYHNDIRISAIDLDGEAIKYAKEQHWIDDGESVNSTILQSADLVIFAIYPNAIKDFLITHSTQFKPGAILTDTAGIKTQLVKELTPLIPNQVDFIFGHPMAGREKRGILFASSSVFINANYILCPLPNNHLPNIDLLANFFLSLGFKRITQVSPEEHDEMIAYTSQLTHILSVALMNSDDHHRETIRFIGDSFRDLTRIANINEQLWTELFIGNKNRLIHEIEQFEHQLTILKDAINEEDYSTLHERFRESSKRRVTMENHDTK